MDKIDINLSDCANSGVSSTLAFKSMKFKNGIARGICYSDQWLDLPSDYILAEEFWGAFYHKSYGEMTLWQAEAKCKADGAFLPTPKSLWENAFFADLYPTGQIWLGLTIVRDGTNLETKRGGNPATFTNWGTDFIYAENIFATWSNAYIDTRNLSLDIFGDLNRWNNNKSKSDVANVVCMKRIPSKCERVLFDPLNLSRDKPFSETGCRKFYPGQWTYGWTSQFGSKLWDNFDDAWEACQSIGDSCGSLAHWGDPIRYEIKSGTGLNAEGPQPNSATKGAWLKISHTKSAYCEFI